jgi:radical SAM superfamily enzyme with C-terminal helix-hairpin-helix motif
MTAGQVYVCESCGLEIEVKRACGDTGACSCTEPVSCCGKPLTLKT